jgi:hypothetical protein
VATLAPADALTAVPRGRGRRAGRLRVDPEPPYTITARELTTEER